MPQVDEFRDIARFVVPDDDPTVFRRQNRRLRMLRAVNVSERIAQRVNGEVQIAQAFGGLGRGFRGYVEPGDVTTEAVDQDGVAGWEGQRARGFRWVYHVVGFDVEEQWRTRVEIVVQIDHAV